MTKRIGKGDIVRAVWVDSIGWSGWHTKEDSEEFSKENAAYESVGFIVDRDDQWITLALSRKMPGSAGKTYGDLHKVPVSAIKSLKRLA